MAESALKLAPVARLEPQAAPAEVPLARGEAPARETIAEPNAAADPKAFPAKAPPRRLRMILLVVIPLLAAAGGLYLYLGGGRYISTDNAYVGSQKVLITPDISGKISNIMVNEGERVAAGQPLFEIDPEPFRLALAQAQAKLAGTRAEFATLKDNLSVTGTLIDLAQQTVGLRQSDVDRKKTLLANRTSTQVDADASIAALVAARTQLQQLIQQRDAYSNQMAGDPKLPIEKYPPFMQAQAALDQAQRDLDHAVVRAPIAGTATQVPAIQLGRYLQAGAPVFSIMDDEHPWVDANPKETDVTYLALGQPVTLKVDAFPDRTFHGNVVAVSPGTGAQFAILPPQNASGNFVKIVQRLPLRVRFAPDQDLDGLRAGMSVVVDIDTGRQRTLAGMFGFSATADSKAPQDKPATGDAAK